MIPTAIRFLPNTNVSATVTGTAWLDVIAPSSVGTYKLYAWNDYPISSVNEYTYFYVTNVPVNPGDINWVQVVNQVTPEALAYKGKAKLVHFSFSTGPEQIDFINNWLVSHFLSELKTQATANNGSKVLKLRLWRDTTKTFETLYKGELELTTPAGFETPFLVTAIIVVALSAIAYYFIVKPLVSQVTDLLYGPEDGSGNRPSIPWGMIAIIAAIVLLSPQLTGGRK